MTLKHDSEMANLNYTIVTTNDGEQHKGDNNIKKYLEFNKDSVSDLSQKDYEKLIEELTNDSILKLPLLRPILHYHSHGHHL